MVMNNLESETEEVFYKGKSYKKLINHGSSEQSVGQFFFAQDNSDEVEEPRKPDYNMFKVVEEQEH